MPFALTLNSEPPGWRHGLWTTLACEPHPGLRRTAAALALVLVAVIGAADYLTGFQISLLPFYFIPVCLATAAGGWRLGAATSVASVGTWMLGDFAAGARFASPLVPVWNGIIALGVCGVVVWLLSSLIEAHRDVEQRVRERTAALRQEIAERERLERAVLEIGERERCTIGRDLHDGLGQHLTGTALLAQALGTGLSARHAAEAGEMRKVISLIEEGIDQTRSLAKGLLLAEIESEGLVDSLAEFAAVASQSFQVECRLRCPEPISLRSNGAATHLFRIAQEAVRNAVRHGRARQVEIALLRQGLGLSLTIRDDGCGLPRPLPPSSRGLGLRIMAHRAALIGATVSVVSQAGGGTVVGCRLPRLPPSP
ncbi:MAG TPA: sensor histidine kinase [Opitutaceae bacterium]|jgi:signal transduction histidine kinase|nr:sensor histidine kinase [Opitutaceae bacterium]